MCVLVHACFYVCSCVNVHVCLHRNRDRGRQNSSFWCCVRSYWRITGCLSVDGITALDCFGLLEWWWYYRTRGFRSAWVMTPFLIRFSGQDSISKTSVDSNTKSMLVLSKVRINLNIKSSCVLSKSGNLPATPHQCFKSSGGRCKDSDCEHSARIAL